MVPITYIEKCDMNIKIIKDFTTVKIRLIGI